MKSKREGFGAFVRSKRIEIGLSLRKFCELAELDPSNWSKIERGRMPAVIEKKKLIELGSLLGIKQSEQDFQKLIDLAYISRKKIPDYVYSDEEVLSALPIFFRTAQGQKPSDEELNKVIELLKSR